MERYEAVMQRFIHTMYLIMLNIQNDCLVLFNELCPEVKERRATIKDGEVEPLISNMPVTIQSPSRDSEWDIV